MEGFKERLQVILYWPTAIFTLLFMVFTWVCVNWWVVLFAVQGTISDKGETRTGWTLPSWLSWFTTFDNDLDAGLLEGETPSWYTRTRWLYRNTAYGFDYFLGVPFESSKWLVKEYSLDSDGNLTFTAEGPYGLFNRHFTLAGWRFKLGWKAWNYYQAETGTWSDKPWGPKYRLPFVFSVSRK